MTQSDTVRRPVRLARARGYPSAAVHDPASVLPSDDVASLLQRAVEEVARLLHADGGMVYLVDEGSGTLRLTHDAGISTTERAETIRGLTLPIGAGMFGKAFAEQRVQRTADYVADASFEHTPAADRVVHDVGIRSMVVAPLVDGGIGLGALGAFSGAPDAFGDADVALVRALADHAAAAMANRRLIERLERSEAELEDKADAERALRELAARITRSHDRSEILDQITSEATTLLEGDIATINVLASGRDAVGWGKGVTPQLQASLGLLDGIGIDPGRGISGLAIAEDRVVWSDDYLIDRRFEHTPDRDAYVRSSGVRSIITAPLHDERGIVGVIQVHSTRVAAFAERHAALLRALADHAAIALTNARLIEELDASRADVARRAEVERSLRQIGARITALRDVDDVIQGAIDEAVRLLHGDGGRIDVVQPDTRLLRGVYVTGESAPPPDVWPDTPDERPEDGISGQAVARNEVVRTGDYLADPAFPHATGVDEYVRRTGIRSVIAAPMPGEDGPFGALTVFSSRSDAFDAAASSTLAALAEQAAVALTNARLISQLGASREELMRRASAERALREIAGALTALREPDAVLQRVVDEADRLVGADGTILSVLDEDGIELRWAFDDGLRSRFDPQYVATLTLPLGVGPTGVAVADRRTIRVDHDLIDQFPAGPENDTFFATTGFRSMVTVPIVAEAGPLGALEVYAVRENGFTEADEALLESLAGQAAVALTNARLIAELRTSRAENARRADRERALREIGSRLTALREPGDVLQQIVADGTRLLGAELGRIDLAEPVDGRRQWLHPLAYPVPPDEDDLTSEAGRSSGLSGLAIQSGAAITTGDYLADDRLAHTPEADAFVRAVGIRAAIAAPLMTEEGLLGVLQAGSPRRDAFGPDHVALIEALAGQAAIAITNARLIAALETSRAELARRADSERTIREIAARLTALREPDDLLVRVVEEARRLLGSDGAHLTLLEENGRFLDPVVVSGALDAETERWFRALRFPVGTGINGTAAGGNELAWTVDYARDARIDEEAAQDFAKRVGIHGMAAAPLREPGAGVIGTLAVSYASPREFSPEDAAALQGLADHAAIAVANSRLLERLQTSESKYRHLVQNSPDLVWAIDADARFTFISDTAERLTGWRAEELLGEHFGSIVHPESREVATRDWTADMAEGATELRGRLELLHRDGHAIPAEFTAQTRVEGGRFAGANGSVRDMTERDRLERELRASEERYRFLVTASPDLTWEVDANGVFTFISDRITELAGYRPEEVVGRHFEGLLHESTRDEAYARYADLIAQPGVVHPARFSIRHRDGHAVPIENFSVGVVRDGAFVGAHGAARDVSERDRLEAGLRRQAAELAASEERAHLARELHDSVTQALFSMTLITRSIELLLSRDPDAAKDRLAALRDLQRDALAEMRSLIFELRPGSLEQDGLVHALRTHGAAVEGRIGLPILIDAEPIGRLAIEIEDALYRIAQEALHNVVRHAAAHEVRIGLRQADGVVRLAIDDDGRGFDPSAVPAGHLGVAGMHARAERVGGRLRVDSKPGAGTRIEVTIPVPAPERQEAVAAAH